MVGGQEKDKQSFYRLSMNILLGALIAKCSRRIRMLEIMQNTSTPCRGKCCRDPGLARINPHNAVLCQLTLGAILSLLHSAILQLTGPVKTTAVNELCLNTLKNDFQSLSVQCPASLMGNC